MKKLRSIVLFTFLLSGSAMISAAAASEGMEATRARLIVILPQYEQYVQKNTMDAAKKKVQTTQRLGLLKALEDNLVNRKWGWQAIKQFVDPNYEFEITNVPPVEPKE